MEKSVAATIEEIKLEEQNAALKLKEKHDLESTLTLLNRHIRETVTRIEKSGKEQIELSKQINKLRSQLELDKIRRDAFIGQIEVNKKELEELRRKLDEGVTEVLSIRASLCNAVQTASDNYDVYALLNKPKSVVSLPKVKIQPVKEETKFEKKLKEVRQRKQDAIKERDRLLNEPETSLEFIGIKTALKNFNENIASLRSS